MKVVGCGRVINWQQCQSAGHPCCAGEIVSMFSAIKTLYHEGDVCISNAGLAHLESLLNGKIDGWRTMIHVGAIDNDLCVYVNCCPYFYISVTALTEGQRQELRGAKTHIQATCISPGMVETEYVFRLHSLHSEKAAATYDSMKFLEAVDIASAVTDVLGTSHVQMRPVEQVS
uniref:Uncharacterized protein n=1 Tax=Oncorhynchus tshawytscha TaxID=74940 RepID=A0A8C8EQ97_ONCTS